MAELVLSAQMCKRPSAGALSGGCGTHQERYVCLVPWLLVIENEVECLEVGEEALLEEDPDLAHQIRRELVVVPLREAGRANEEASRQQTWG